MRLALAPLVAALGFLALPGGAFPQDEPLRPQFHFSPAKNFMKRPQRARLFRGRVPPLLSAQPGRRALGHMSWGHAVSPDLVRWTHLPVALREEDGIMIFSGSVVVDHEDRSGSAAGGRAWWPSTPGIPDRQTQNLAVSRDRGRTFTKYAGNPVLDLGRKDFRDPKVLWHAPTARFVMVAVLPDEHKVRFFGSRDLKRWDTLSDFGPRGPREECGSARTSSSFPWKASRG